MDYTNLLNDSSGKKSKVGIIGATRGYGYTLLAQIPKVKLMDLRVICSRHPDECQAVLKEIGYKENQIVYCETKEAIHSADEDAVFNRKRLPSDAGMWNYSAGRMYRKHHSQRRCGSHCIKKRN